MAIGHDYNASLYYTSSRDKLQSSIVFLTFLTNPAFFFVYLAMHHSMLFCDFSKN